MACCADPQIGSSVHVDWCENCGASFSYEHNDGDLYDFLEPDDTEGE